MKEFMKIVGGVALGTLLASGAAVSMLLNPRVLKAYTKRVMSVSEEISKEIMDTDYDD